MNHTHNAHAPKGGAYTQDLFPDLSPEQQETARENLDRYVRLTWCIFVRLEVEQRAALTELPAPPTMDSQRSSDTNNKFISE